MTESERGLALSSADPTTAKTISNAYFTYVAARAALIAGDKAKALEWLGESMRLRYFVTPEWLRIDPTWNAVRNDPRFQKILSGL